MDHHPLRDAAGHKSEEVRRGSGRPTDPSTRGPTDDPRRISTDRGSRRSPDRRHLLIPSSDDNNMNDESFSFPTTRSYSWESHSDGEDRGGGGSANRSSVRRDQRKFDMTTPTLIDEMDDVGADEEEEMVSLQRARMRQEERGVVVKDESSLRRTPGASMYKSSLPEDQLYAASLRRTPGALDMLRSAEGSAGVPHQHHHHPEQADESGVLGFGLTLSTPVATTGGTLNDRGEAWEHGHGTTTSKPMPTRAQQSTSETVSMPHPSRPPRAPDARSLEQQQQQRTEFSFAPWTLAKGTQFESRHGACSPNTLRLTEDLGNLLFEEEDSFEHVSQEPFGGAAQRPSDSGAGDRNQRELSAESWTSSYVFNSEHVGDIPSRVPRSSMGRGRRGRNDSSNRRSRGQDRSSYSRGNDDQAHQQHVASFLKYAQQPKPVRSMQASSLGNPFLSGGFDPPSTGPYPPSDSSERQGQPRFFNFGGAFAPPSKDASVGFRPPAPAPPREHSSVEREQRFFGQSRPQTFQTGTSSGFADSGATGGSFQSQSFQPLPHMTAPSRDSPFQHSFPSPNPGYGSAAGSPPPYGFTSAVAYAPSHLTGIQGTSNDFFPMPVPQPEPRSNVGHYAQPSHNWPAAPPPAHYAVAPPTNQGTWTRSSAPWIGNEHAFGVSPPPGMDSQLGQSPPPVLASSSWNEKEPAEIHSKPPPSSNAFVAVPSAQFEAPQQAVSVSASPVFSGASTQNRRELQSSQPTRLKSSRKGQTRRSSKHGKSEKGRKGDTGQTGAQTNPRRATPVNTSSTGPTSSAVATASGSVATVRKKKSKGRDSKTPEIAGTASACSTPANVPATASNLQGGEEGTPVPIEDSGDAKRAELIESPATRSAFKDFYRRFRAEERSSFQGAEEFAIQSLGDGSLPGKVHWRVYLELADLAKRSNRFADARRLYQQVCRLQPYASQGWLEYSKLEEECGHLSRGAKILRAGLEYCEYSENLLTRAIKHEEKMGNLGRARELLARLKHVGIEKVWRTVLEGALLEARAGNVVMARRVLKYLMHHVPWYGPLYLEAYRLERDLGRTSEALEVVERGLAAIPRYGPLWFGAFRLCEHIDITAKDFDLPKTMAMIDRATLCISKELIWKVHLDAAQMLERAALDHRAFLREASGNADVDFSPEGVANCRNRFAMTILNCPPNLRWKVWLAAGRMEIAVGNPERARRLFLRAHKVVPEKGRATTLLECARLEEFTGDTDLARSILCKSRFDYGSDWKVWLESVLLEIRGGRNSRAIELAKGALDIHPGTGRLWAALVQLRFFDGGEEAQFASLRLALNAVPKSGEVWCEGGRIHLNPLSRTFNLDRARRHLFFATRFTPQYGDSFLESLRLELLEQWIVPIADLVWEASKSYLLDAEANAAVFSRLLETYISDLLAWLLPACQEKAEAHEAELESSLRGMLNSELASSIRDRLTPSAREATLNLCDLELRCANADPNYGLLWFHCRHGPTDTARRILARATEKVVAELRRFVPIYIAAIVRHTAILGALGLPNPKGGNSTEGTPSSRDEEEAVRENLVDATLLSAPSLFDRIMALETKKLLGMAFLENAMTGSTTFATGLAELNRHQPLADLPLNERRKALFGTDALFS